MRTSPIRPLIVFLVALAGLLYTFSIGFAGYLSIWSDKNKMDPLLISAVIVIGGVLSTNLGAVLGSTLTPPANPAGSTTASGPTSDTNPHSHPTYLALRSSFQPDPQAAAMNTVDTSQKVQIIACWLYVASLVVALLFWIIAKIKGIADTALVQLLPELVKTLFGIMVGSMTVALGRAS